MERYLANPKLIIQEHCRGITKGMENIIRGAGTGGAGGAIAPPIFGSSIRIHSNSTTNIFGYFNIY